MVISKLLFSFGIILSGLLAGYTVQLLAARGRIRLPLSIDALRKGLQRTALLFVNPVAIVGATWTVNIRDAALMALPFVGLFAIVTGGVLALGGRKAACRSPRKRRGRFSAAAPSPTSAPSAPSSDTCSWGTRLCARAHLQDLRGTILLLHGFPHREVLQREHGHRRALGPREGPARRTPSSSSRSRASFWAAPST